MTKNSIPWVKKQSITIVPVGAVGSEPEALRNILEAFNWRVDIIWIASRKEFMKVLDGTIKTADYVVIPNHGCDKGIIVPDEEYVTPEDIAEVGKLAGKTIISTGCTTGRKVYGDAFIKKAKAKAYIAPIEYPAGNSALMFVARLFYELSNKKSLRTAVSVARKLDKETARFGTFQKT